MFSEGFCFFFQIFLRISGLPRPGQDVDFQKIDFFKISGLPRPGQDADFPEF